MWKEKVLRDTVTNLYEYSYFQEMCIDMIRANTDNKRYCVLYTDFMNFKMLNRMYGFQEGNRMLNAYGDFLNQLEGKGMATRVFSDYFIKVFSIDEDTRYDQVVLWLEKELTVFLEGQQSYHPQCNLQVAGGVCEIRKGVQRFVTAVDNANSARKIAKTSFRNQVVFFDSHLEDRIEKESLLSVAIHSAIEKKEIQFFLQPKVNLITGEVTGAEALARWIQEDGTMVSPVEFIPLMERDGSIIRADFMIYEQVCQYLQERIRRAKVVVPISVNVSRVHLRNLDFAKDVHKLVSSYGINPSLLEFELTENIFIGDLGIVLAVMGELRQYGYKVSVDDFGAGYSSLNLLRKLDFDVLKLDKSFLDDNGQDSEKNAIIVSSVVEIARGLHTEILCEGIETMEHVIFMKNMGCMTAQGFFFSKPVSRLKFDEILRTNRGFYVLPQNEV